MSQSVEELKTELETFKDSIRELKEKYEYNLSVFQGIGWKSEALVLKTIVEDLEELLK